MPLSVQSYGIVRVLLGLLVYSVGLTAVFFNDSEVLSNGAILTVSVISLLQLFRISLYGRQDSIGFMFNVAAVLLFLFPGPAVTLIFGIDVTPYVLIFIFVSDVFPALSRRFQWGLMLRPRRLETVNLKHHFVYLGLILTFLVALGFVSSRNMSDIARLLHLEIPMVAAALVYERIIAKNSNTFTVILAFSLVMGGLFAYMVFHWHGGGRLRMGSYILLFVLITNHYRDIGIRIWQLAVFAPILLLIAQWSRYGRDINNLDAGRVFIGSAGHHLIVTHDAWNSRVNEYYGGLSAFFDQYLLLWFNWLPRGWWPDKPLGAGLISVDHLYGRVGQALNHSISLGFVGEQRYLLGQDFIFGLIVVLGTLLLIRWGVSRLSYGYVFPIILFDVFLISYIWGSQGTFGARFWFHIIPALLMVFIASRVRLRPRQLTGMPVLQEQRPLR